MKRSVIPLSVGALLAAASPAQAHLMNSGFGPFYDGLAHPFLVPEDLLPVIALTLLAGLRGARCGRWVVLALPVVWVAGMITAAAIHLPSGPVWLTCALTIALGALVAADRPWPVALVVGLATLAGTTHGFGNGRELAAIKGGGLAMAGIACALFVVSALTAGQVATVRAHWARVVVRVAGSWIAAIGLLMLGWSMRTGQ
jgi:hydrogenase/urease accessory protein HupE